MKPVSRQGQKAYLMMHLAVLLYGLTGILGREISLQGMPLVWYRMALTALSLCLFPAVFRHIRQMPRSLILQFAGIGVLMAIHWVTFFESIKLSNVTVGLSALSTTAFFTSMIEPLVFRKKISYVEVVLGLLVITGLVLIFQFGGTDMVAGILVGLFSALVVACASVWNKSVVEKSSNVYSMVLIEFAAGVLFLSALMPLYWQTSYAAGTLIPGWYDFILLLILALLCTTLAYSLNMRALKQLSAFASNLLINLEPIYAIILAALIYQEYKDLHPGFYGGALLIILAVFTYPILMRRQKKSPTSEKQG